MGLGGVLILSCLVLVACLDEIRSNVDTNDFGWLNAFGVALLMNGAIHRARAACKVQNMHVGRRSGR
jgi:hypothetical protein